MNREPIRSPARSVANLEFHHTGRPSNEVARGIVAALEAEGRPGGQPGDGLPDGDGPLPRQDLGRLAQAGRRRGGPGSDGHPPQRHPPEVRQLHPPGHGPDRRRGLRADAGRSTTTRAWSASSAWRPARSGPSAPTATSTSRPASRTTTGSSWAASPTGSSTIADSKDARDYRRRVADERDRRRCGRASRSAELQGGLLPGRLPGGRGRDRPVPGRPQGRSSRRSSTRCRRRRSRSTSSPARTPRSTSRGGSRTRRSGGSAAGCGPGSIRAFLFGLPLTSSSGRPREGLDATYHFTFTGRGAGRGDGRDPGQDDRRSRRGTSARPSLRVTADSETWLGFLAKERSLVWALLRGKIRVRGSPRLLVAFGKCFPS